MNPGAPKRCSMLCTVPVTRLSSTTTWSPRASSASHRCDPMKPAPPVTTTRRISAPSVPADSGVGEAAPAQRFTVEQVASVDYRALTHRLADLVEVEPLELVPLGQHDEGGRPVARRIRIAGQHDAFEIDGSP